MSEFLPFPFTDHIMERFRENKEIPVNFYNKKGQALIHKKENASPEEIERLFRFMEQGIYYNKDDEKKLGIEKKKEIPDGLSETKLLSKDHTKALTVEATQLFANLKKTSISSLNARRSTEKMVKIFEDFEKQPDAMNGLINILELLSGGENSYDIELAVKRTVVAMAMKTRGMQATSRSYEDLKRQKKAVSNLMMSAMLCDSGYFRMNMPMQSTSLNLNEMDYVRNHPLMSYLMIAHDHSLDKEVKHNILCHHRPKHDGLNYNNYPNLKVMVRKLVELETKYRNDPDKKHIAKDIRDQLQIIKERKSYEEDLNIIALASEFASLTTDVPWRKAFTPVRAVRMIVNNSYFTYADRIIREFLDHVAISLCDNQKIVKENDYLIVESRLQDHGPVFEVCRINSVGRYQSRPLVSRIATITPVIKKIPKVQFITFSLEKMKPDPRKAVYDLSNDDTRHIVYFIDPSYDKELYEGLIQLQ